MRALLDTNVLLWWMTDDSRLAEKAAEIINDGSNDLYVSAVSAMEIAIKTSIGKLRGVPGDLRREIRECAFEELPVTIEHGMEVGALPLHHRDPFDRLLVAQARCEGLRLITADKKILAYDVRVISASAS